MTEVRPACDDYINSLVEALDVAEESGFPLHKTKIERKLIARIEQDRAALASVTRERDSERALRRELQDACEDALRERRLHGDIPDAATAMRKALARAAEHDKDVGK